VRAHDAIDGARIAIRLLKRGLELRHLIAGQPLTA